MESKKTILVTGGAGFIGNHVIRLLLNKYPNYKIVNGDKLTYAGNLENLKDVQDRDNYEFERVDIVDREQLNRLWEKHEFTDVIHLAAESHVDRSIENPAAFVETNVIGTANLLAIANAKWEGDGHLFYHVSTDEVYGSLGATGFFTEETSYDPRSPYSASKASSDHLVRAYFHTFQLPVVISNCSNNYGPYQFPEKLIPLMINNIIEKKDLPVYGDGTNVRDWLWVVDHAEAIDCIFHKGKIGETYNIGGENEIQNIDLVKTLCKVVDRKLGRAEGDAATRIKFVTDRKGHDHRYAIDASKVMKELGWKPTVQPEQGLEMTVDWYLSNTDWLQNITSGDYEKYYEKFYNFVSS